MALIRPVEGRDWQAVHDLVVEVATAGETYALDVPGSVEETRAFWCGEHVAVAVDGDTVLGAVKMGANRPGQGAHIGTAAFVVGATARRQGLGRQLGEYAVAWHRGRGYRGIQFNAVVSTNVAAVRLWRSLGFETIGLVPGGFRLPSGEYADLHVMFLDLLGPTGSEGAVPVEPYATHGDAGLASRQERARVVDVAIRQFAESGYAATTLAGVASESGVPYASVVRAFGTRAELLMIAFRRASFGDHRDLQAAFRALALDRLESVDSRLDRLVEWVSRTMVGMAPMGPPLLEAVGQDPTARAIRQGAELRRVAMSRSLVRLLDRTGSPAPDAVGAVHTLLTAETYASVASLGWSPGRYASWLRGALDHAVNAPGGS